MDSAKQEAIFNAAFDEFREHGYHKASTNRIVEKAGISKGTLFYYFNSKKELYQDLVNYSIDLIKKEYIGLMDEAETDFVEKYRLASQIKLKAYQRHLPMFAFFGKLYLNSDESILDKDAIEKVMEIRAQAFSKFYDNVDTSLFREDIKPQQVMQLIGYAMTGYEQELTAKMKDIYSADMDLTPYWKDFYEFLDALKKVFYKEGK